MSESIELATILVTDLGSTRLATSGLPGRVRRVQADVTTTAKPAAADVVALEEAA